MRIKFYRDEIGSPHADVAEPYTIVGRYLRSDVQSFPGWCKELINIVNDVAIGKRQIWEGTGNLFTVTITKDNVHIEQEPDEEVFCDISLNDFNQALEGWLSLIESEGEK